jgi:hypothetical protein
MAEIRDEDIPAIRDALLFMLADTSAYGALRDKYRAALDRLPGPGECHPGEVRYVSSSDSAGSGDEISLF